MTEVARDYEDEVSIKTLALPDLATNEFASATVNPIRQIELAVLDVGYSGVNWAPSSSDKKVFEIHGADDETAGFVVAVDEHTPTTIGRSAKLPAKSLSRNQLAVQMRGGARRISA